MSWNIKPLQPAIGPQRVLPVEAIIIHCSATPPNGYINSAARIDSMHRDQNGWDGIGYHVVIKEDGTVEGGRSLDRWAAAAKGYNSKGWHICLIGGLDERRQPADTFTINQWLSLEDVVKGLQDKSIAEGYGVLKVMGHRDVDPMKACPCFDAGAWWAGVLEKMEVPFGMDDLDDPKYQEGYAQGHTDGYVDGCRDQLASIKRLLNKLEEKS